MCSNSRGGRSRSREKSKATTDEPRSCCSGSDCGVAKRSGAVLPMPLHVIFLGKLVKIQEAENQMITHFEVFAERPDDSKLLLPSIQVHQRKFRRVPGAVA